MLTFDDELDALVRDDYLAHDPKRTAIKKLVDRYYLPRPLFEDGEPVQFNDKCRGEDGETLWLSDVQIGHDGTCKLTGYDGVEDHHSFFCMAGERVKRPEPEVLDADGVPIRVGDTVWTSDGMEWRVNRVDGTTVHATTPGGGSGVYPFPDDGVSPFTHTPPDSIERVVEDMRRQIAEWDTDDTYLNGAMVAYERIRDRLCDIQRRAQ